MSNMLQDIPLKPLSGKRLALVVGVNGQPAPGRAPLYYAARDGKDIAEILQLTTCSFELFRPPLLDKQATTSRVRNAVLDLADQLQDDDFALFFFSGLKARTEIPLNLSCKGYASNDKE